MTLSGIYIGLIAYRLKHKIPLTDNMQRVWLQYQKALKHQQKMLSICKKPVQLSLFEDNPT